MESKRYGFGGFVFGSNGDFQLQISTLKNGSTSAYTAQFELELTVAERQELITLLITTTPAE